jgi:hypothetical protein
MSDSLGRKVSENQVKQYGKSEALKSKASNMDLGLEKTLSWPPMTYNERLVSDWMSGLH